MTSIVHELSLRLPRFLQQLADDPTSEDDGGLLTALLVDGDAEASAWLSPFLVLSICEKAFVSLSFFVDNECSLKEFLIQVGGDLDNVLSLLKPSSKHRRLIRIAEDLATFVGMRLAMIDVLLALLAPVTVWKEVGTSAVPSSSSSSGSESAHAKSLAALARVIAAQQKIRSRHVRSLVDRAVSEAHTIEAYVQARDAVDQRRYGPAVVAAHRLRRLLQQARTISENRGADGQGLPVPPSSSPEGIGALFLQWSEALSAEMRVVFCRQIARGAALVREGSGDGDGDKEDGKQDPDQQNDCPAAGAGETFDDLAWPLPPSSTWFS
jgi:hypothetical protein